MNPSSIGSREPQVRVRFAPSPTGFLHVGGVRTALFNWLFAKKHHGKFLLRIEDTDTERSEQQFTDDILASLRWLGLEWDEEIVYQSKKTAQYSDQALSMVASGQAYCCFCSEEQVEAMRQKATAEGKKPQYDRTCRNKVWKPSDLEKSHVIRAKIPLEGITRFEDLIHGSIEFQNTDLDDFVIIRSNGAPTYHLSVVVDDIDMRITHVIRGDDHINNTPKQTFLYHALKNPLPLFAHLPMIMGADKKKLSKRHGDVSANVYRTEGYLPDGLLNFLVRLGWSHGDQEIFTRAEMIQHFDFKNVQKSAAVFNPEKLIWLNGTHVRLATPETLAQIVLRDFPDFFPSGGGETLHSKRGLQLVQLIQQKVKLVKDLADQLAPLCVSGKVEVNTQELKWNKDPQLKILLKSAVSQIIKVWSDKVALQTKIDSSLGELGMDSHSLHEQIKQVCDQRGIKLGDLTQPMRLAVSGRSVSAGFFDLAAVLPWKSVVLPRLESISQW